MASPSPSSSYKYDVFLSFRGEDTRDNFTSHLYAALCRKKIKTFIDDEELSRGDEISPALLNSIEGSKISIIVFSKNYASSKWCLDELVKILECHKMIGQIVIPVFYHVDPSDVRKQTGSFRNAFIKHEKQFKEMPEKVRNWRDVLTEASNLSGLTSKEIRPEAKLVDEIINDVLRKLEDILPSSDFKGLIGLESRVEQIKSLLCIGLPDFRIVGIWGMGGIGKTTIAGVVFNQFSIEFEGKCFMANIREESKKGDGLVHLREKILSQVLGENLKIETPYIPQYTLDRLRRLKVFIVLDDVNRYEQLEYLVGHDRFGLGSRIIVTTRDKNVLERYGVDQVHKMWGLNYNEALELFCSYALRQNHHSRDLLVLSHSMVHYADGSPLFLKVLGSSLHQKSKQEWEQKLCNLKRIFDPDIYNVLKISYDELNWKEQNLFLDIACFFQGENIDYVIRIQDDPKSVRNGLNILVDKSLITISSDKRLQMHDHLQEMGREIVRQESVKEPGKRSRLWYHKDVYHVLKKNKGTDAIEGIFLDLSKIGDIHLTSRAFANMSNLKLLKFYLPEHDIFPIMKSKVHFDQGLEYLPEELRYLHWHGYPLKTLPLYFDPENLIELSLPSSKVEQIWEGKKEAPKLKSINLHHALNLTRIPEPSEIPNLERMNLWNCTSLAHSPSFIQNFDNLGFLCLMRCESLRCFTSNIHFRSPIKIDFSGCVNLTKFPQISGNVEELKLWCTPIEEVPSSIQWLTNLKSLELIFCKRLKWLSSSICKLKCLRCLNLGYCSNLEIFPEILEKMELLEELNLESTGIKELPSSIELLEGLKELKLRGCSKLGSLPDSICNLKALEILIAQRSARFNMLDAHSFFRKGLALPPSLSGLSSLKRLELSECDIIEIPPDITCLSSLKLLNLSGNYFESLPTSISQLSRLKRLYLYNCNMLRSLPELPLGLVMLNASNCRQLSSLLEFPSYSQDIDTSVLETLSNHTRGSHMYPTLLKFASCRRLNEQANKSILADLHQRIQHLGITSQKVPSSLVSFSLLVTSEIIILILQEFGEPYGMSICLPGSGIPGWFMYQSSGSSITIELPQLWCNRYFIGLAVCAVIEFGGDSETSGLSIGVGCKYGFDHFFRLVDRVSFNSDHVILGIYPCGNIRLPDDEHQTAVSFEFLVDYVFPVRREGHMVKYCGVSPVYDNPNQADPSTCFKFAASSEKECTGATQSVCSSYKDEVESICREESNAPQQQSSLFAQLFHKRDGLFAFLIYVFLVLISSSIPFWRKWAVDQ